MNALSSALRAALVAAFDECARDPDVGVVILTGAGRAFCAGLDLKELGGESGPAGITGAVATGGIIEAMARCDRPIIGAVNGFAITGGFEVALACDVLVASTAAQFADTHARVGILPGWGLSQRLSRTIGIYRAKELSLTGNYLSAEQAAAWGLVNRVVHRTSCSRPAASSRATSCRAIRTACAATSASSTRASRPPSARACASRRTRAVRTRAR